MAWGKVFLPPSAFREWLIAGAPDWITLGQCQRVRQHPAPPQIYEHF